MDDIKDRFGDIAILRASSITAAGQAIDRASKIGGITNEQKTGGQWIMGIEPHDASTT